MTSSRYPIYIISLSFIFSMFLLILSGLFVWNSYRELNTIEEQNFRLQKLTGIIIHLDEVLTMSTMMASTTDDKSWIVRYKKNEPLLDKAIKKAKEIAPESFLIAAASQTDDANKKLVEMEKRSFIMIEQGDLESAQTIIKSEDYKREKVNYKNGMEKITNEINNQIKAEFKNARQRGLFATVFVGVSIFILILFWFYIDKQLNRYFAERKQAEDALRKSEEKYRELVENANSIILRMDSESKVTFFNEFAQHFFGFSEDEILGCNTVGTIVPEMENSGRDLKALIRDITKKTDRYAYSEYENMCKDGKRVWVAWTNKAIFDNDGRVSEILCVGTDITERKQTEKELKEQYDFSNNVIESSLDAIVVTDSQGIIIQTNKAYQKLLGFSEEELIGKHTAELPPKEEGKYESTTTQMFQVDETFFLTSKAMIAELFENNQIYNWSTYLLRKDRKLVPVEESIVLLKDINGETIGAVGIIRDITDRIQVEENREMLQNRLNRAEKMETIGTLAGGVAHDLNNILGAVVGYPELMLDDIPTDSPLRSSILAIKESGERAVAVIQDLLTLARRGISISEVNNLNSIITKYLAAPEFQKLEEFHPNVSLETNLATDLLNILGSPVHLSKVVMNLVSNAAESMQAGGKILVSTENIYLDKTVRGYDKIKGGDYTLLTVSDEGTGISGKDLKRIFEPFYSKKVMGRSGTGLGMAVVWGTVKDHKGYIDVESKEGIGTIFKLYFPVTRDEIEDKDRPVPIEEYVGNGENVLIIDDVKAQREVASNMLTKLNYHTETVKGGEEAVEYLKNNSADILVLDMIMDPGIDGLETYKRILEIHPQQKAVIASGFSETDRVREVQELGASTYIKKPYTLEKIGLAVKAELKNTSL